MIELGTDDKMACLETPDGQSFKPDAQGVLRVPEPYADYARLAARVVPMFGLRRRIWGGVDMSALAPSKE